MTGDQIIRLAELLDRRYGARAVGLYPIVEYGDAQGGVYRIDRRDGPSWVARVFARDRPLERVQGVAAVLAFVGHHDVPAERLVSARDGSTSGALDGQGVVVTQFIVGTRPDRYLTTLRRLGAVLGQIHALPPVPNGDPWLGRRAGAIPAEDLPYGRACLARVAGRVPPEDTAAYEALRTALDTTDDCEALPSALIHSDCHLDNALLTPDGHSVFIDWVGSGQGPRVAALGLLLYSCVVQSPGDAPDSRVEPNLGWMRLAVEAVIDGYCRHHCLTGAELDHLPDAVRFRPVVVAARELANSIERGESANPAGWWTRYGEAETVATYARTAMERYRWRRVAGIGRLPACRRHRLNRRHSGVASRN